MIELKCDRCGENCGLNASVIDIHVVHNPNPVRFGDIGEIRLTDDNTHIRYMLCQSCYDKQGLPNPYRTGEKLVEEIKNSGVVHAVWVAQCCTVNTCRWVCSRCETEAKTDKKKQLAPYCSFCGAKMNNPGSDYSRTESENNV